MSFCVFARRKVGAVRDALGGLANSGVSSWAAAMASSPPHASTTSKRRSRNAWTSRRRNTSSSSTTSMDRGSSRDGAGVMVALLVARPGGDGSARRACARGTETRPAIPDGDSNRAIRALRTGRRIGGSDDLLRQAGARRCDVSPVVFVQTATTRRRCVLYLMWRLYGRVGWETGI